MTQKKTEETSQCFTFLNGYQRQNLELQTLMNYKKSKDSDTYYFSSQIKKNKDKIVANKKKVSPFSKLLALNIK